jgi:hypothetical protein
MPWTVDIAGKAAYHALKEARCQEPLQYLDRVHILGVVDMDSGELTEHPEPLAGEQFTDEELCENESSDAAGAAAVAFSCGAEGPWCDSERLGAFWVWWLKEAIPEAWETAYREKVT